MVFATSVRCMSLKAGPNSDLARCPLLCRFRGQSGQSAAVVEQSRFVSTRPSLVAAATVSAVTPASAQVWFDTGPVAVRVGPPPWPRHRVVERVHYEPPAVTFASASAGRMAA